MELMSLLGCGTPVQAYTTPNQEEGLTKVVLARRTDIMLSGQLEPLSLLEALQARLHGIVARVCSDVTASLQAWPWLYGHVEKLATSVVRWGGAPLN